MEDIIDKIFQLLSVYGLKVLAALAILPKFLTAVFTFPLVTAVTKSRNGSWLANRPSAKTSI